MNNETTYVIPVHYECWGVVTVKATSIEEAAAKVLEKGEPPEQLRTFVPGSLKIDTDCYTFKHQEAKV